MTEREYIDATNLTKLRLASHALFETNFPEGSEYWLRRRDAAYRINAIINDLEEVITKRRPPMPPDPSIQRTEALQQGEPVSTFDLKAIAFRAASLIDNQKPSGHVHTRIILDAEFAPLAERLARAETENRRLRDALLTVEVLAGDTFTSRVNPLDWGKQLTKIFDTVGFALANQQRPA